MSDPLTTQTPIAGWYPDPEHAGSDRWWDGIAWSETRRPSTAVTAPVPGGGIGSARAPRNTLAIVGFILALTGVVIPIVLNSLAGGVVSVVALQRSKRLAAEGVQPTGRAFALTGILVGFIWGALSILIIVGIIAFASWFVAFQHQLQYPDSPVV